LRERSPVSPTGLALQRVLPVLMAWRLDLLQARWNVTGHTFAQWRELTAELVVCTDRMVDRIAARARVLDVFVDLRASTVAAAAGSFPAERITTMGTTVELLASIGRVVSALRDALEQVPESDSVSWKVLVDALERAEHWRWLLRSTTG